MVYRNLLQIDLSSKINDDKIIVRDILSKHSTDIPTEIKPIRFGKPITTSTHPINIILTPKMLHLLF